MEPPTKSSCQLLGGVFSYFVQFALGLLALSSLYVKWRFEKPRRSLEVVVYDVSKQAISACFCHGFNMLLAVWLASSSSDECAWYFINYIFDTIFAVFFSWGLLRLLETAARRRQWIVLSKVAHTVQLARTARAVGRSTARLCSSSRLGRSFRCLSAISGAAAVFAARAAYGCGQCYVSSAVAKAQDGAHSCHGARAVLVQHRPVLGVRSDHKAGQRAAEFYVLQEEC